MDAAAPFANKDEARLDLPPSPSAYLTLPENFGRRFTVSIDTEEAFDWSAPFRRDGYTSAGVRALPAFQARMDSAGVRPLYLANHAIATDAAGAAILRSLHGDGRCTIGTHLHPWTTPPFDEALGVRNSFAGNLPEPVERAKLEAASDAVAALLGARPHIFRAGRYGVGPNTGRLLAALGYEVDVSVRALFHYGDQGGPVFTRIRPIPYRVGPLLEIPLGAAYLGALHPGPLSPDLGRFLTRLRLLRRVALTPEGVSAALAKAAIDRLIDEDVRLFSLSFHSPSLEPGNTPYVRDSADLARFDSWWDIVFDHFARRGVEPAGIEEAVAACRRAEAQRQAGPPHQAQESSAPGRPIAAPYRRA